MRPVLLYRETCAKCRVASLAVVWLSFGVVRRIALSSPAGRALREEHGVAPGKLALIAGRRSFEVGTRLDR